MSASLGADFARILERNLDALATQIRAYPDDESVWRVADGITNSAGTLAVHLVGNLQHFVGSALGGTGYVRDREREFGERDVPREEILARIVECRETVTGALATVEDAVMRAPYPGTLPPAFEGWSTHLFLIHLAAHFGWHLGEVDYHRRLLT